VSMIVKGLSKKKPIFTSLTEPLCEVEFVYTKGSSDLLKFQDGTLIDPHLNLREKYSFLQTALEMAQAVLKSQMPEKPSPLLYALFSSFLKQIPYFSFPDSLLGSFYLKFLKHEGHFNSAAPFRPDMLQDWHLVLQLCEAHSFHQLKEIKISPQLLQKIKEELLQKTKTF
jgi:DNA repair protein RecO